MIFCYFTHHHSLKPIYLCPFLILGVFLKKKKKKNRKKRKKKEAQCTKACLGTNSSFLPVLKFPCSCIMNRKIFQYQIYNNYENQIRSKQADIVLQTKNIGKLTTLELTLFGILLLQFEILLGIYSTKNFFICFDFLSLSL